MLHILAITLRSSIHELISAGGDLLSRWTHYHWPRVLIGRVRDGNGSFHLGMATGKLGDPGIGIVYSNNVVGCSRSLLVTSLVPTGVGVGVVWSSGRLLVPVG